MGGWHRERMKCKGSGRSILKDEITGKMIKGGGDRVGDWIWILCNMAFESSVYLKTGDLQ